MIRSPCGRVDTTLRKGTFFLTPNYLGIAVEEERGLDQIIARLGTARTAFVGRTLRGPVNQPIFVTSFSEFRHVFGGLWQPSPLGYAVEHYFDNGGREAYVVRVVNGARSATLTLRAGTESLKLRAVRPGTREFLRASVDYDNVPADEDAQFNLTVQRVRLQGTEQVEDQEIFARVSILPGSERFIGDVLAGSALARLTGAVPRRRPDRTLNSASGLATRYANASADGDDGEPLTDYDLIGSELDRTGLFALDAVDYFNLLCIPPLSRDRDVGPGALVTAARYCKQRRALLIVDPPAEWHTADDALRGLRQWEFWSENALMYFPRVLALDKLRGQFEAFGSCGAVAGMLARSDESFPVWGPTQMEDAILRPGFRPSCLVSEDRRIRLAAFGVNTIQSVRSAARLGVAPRTLAVGSAGAAEWQNLAARRLALFILNCITRGTRWVVFARQQRDVAEAVILQMNAFFERLHDDGAFGNRSREESYFALCDGRVNVPDHAASNEFQLVIGFAAARRGEFHTFRITHTAAGSRSVSVSTSRLNFEPYSPAGLEWVDELASQLGADS